MNIAHLNQWLSDRELKAICWTLIHSLWQGLLIAALAGLAIAATRKASAKVRYGLFCALLVLFIMSMGCTFMYELGWGGANAPVNTLIAITPDGSVIGEPALVNGKVSFLNTLTGFLNDHAAGIFAIWLVFFLYKSCKLLGGIFYIHRIRTQRTVQAATALKDKVGAFAYRIGISKTVNILQSELVKVPVTLGYFKPLIILPVGIIFQLSTEQVETILWHELAHIRRRDYLVNILQSIVEAILFFNPAILWLSALIREEREACCDDIVLANVQQKGSYLEALLAFQGRYAATGSLAMALSLRPNQLMNRLRRMVYQENKKLSTLEMVVLLAGLLLFSAFTFIPQVKPALKNSVAFIKETISYTFPEAPPPTVVKRKHTRVRKQVADTVTAESKHAVVTNDTTIQFKSILFKNTNQDKANGAKKKHRADSSQTTPVAGLKKLKKHISPSDAAFVAEKPKPKKKRRPVDISADQGRVRGVMEDLVNAQVVANMAEVESFGLSETELMVNDKKQPAELQRKLMETYGIKHSYGLYYGPVKMGGKGVILDKGDL